MLCFGNEFCHSSKLNKLINNLFSKKKKLLIHPSQIKNISVHNAVIHNGNICSETDLVQTILYMLLDIGSFGVEILQILSNRGHYETCGS